MSKTITSFVELVLTFLKEFRRIKETDLFHEKGGIVFQLKNLKSL